MSQAFLGVGWKFPLEVAEGDIALSHYEQDIQQAIRIIIETAPGERLMHPDFGCGIHDYVFAPNDTRTAGLVRFHVDQALSRWEPRIELEQVNVQAAHDDPAVLLVSIDYRVRATDSRSNLVYPFYLQRSSQA